MNGFLSTGTHRLLGISSALLLTAASAALAAVPFNRATVTRLENDVNVGRQSDAQGAPAKIDTVVNADQYVLTKTQSRAELQFPDTSFVRVGQNTIFTFQGGSRTLTLQKGAMLFYIPKGSGGGTIKTPTLTAAVTGTSGIVGVDFIAVLEGELQTKFGVVPAGYKITSAGKTEPFNEAGAREGRLYNFGPPPPGLAELLTTPVVEIPKPDVRLFDVLEITQVNPIANNPPPVIRPEKKPKPSEPKEENHESGDHFEPIY